MVSTQDAANQPPKEYVKDETTTTTVIFLLTLIAELRRPESGAPYSNTYRKGKETHELIFLWLSWLAVLLVGA